LSSGYTISGNPAGMDANCSGSNEGDSPSLSHEMNTNRIPINRKTFKNQDFMY
jgi:hypothetical protein